jgi:hypothetical protein
MFSFCLLAQGPKPAGSPFDRPDLIIGTAGLAGALLVGAFVIFLVDRWRKRAALADVADAGTELTGFRAMYERGEITEEEYNRLRLKVSERVKPAPETPSPLAGTKPNAAAPAAETPPKPIIPGPLPPEYFEDPEPPSRPVRNEEPPGERSPPA